MTESLAYLTANATGLARRVTHSGRQYLVAPYVAVVPGVLNGELLTLEEVSKYPDAWNGRPIVLGHPQQGGQYISANTPDTLAQALGRIHNAAWADGRLKFETWLDIERCQSLGGDYLKALQQIEAGQPTEGSTAYWRDLEPTPGTWDGKSYSGIARNMRPDHYAILLNEPGACSWADGCGGPRVNAAENSDNVMIGFWLRPEDAQALALSERDLPKGSQPTPANELHLTLCHLGKIADLRVTEEELQRALIYFVQGRPIVRGTINGVGQFANTNEEGLQPLFANFDSPTLPKFRQILINDIQDFGAYYNQEHGYTPHITLAYVPAGQIALSLPEQREIVFDSVALAWGNRITQFKLQGEPLMLTTNGKRKVGHLITKAVDAWTSQEMTRQKVVADLAKKSELSESDFEKALAGQFDFDEKTARRVAKALGIPEDEIAGALAEPVTDPAPEAEPATNSIKSLITALTGFFSTNSQPPKEAPMTDKCKLIDGLIANGVKVKREALEAMDEATLQALGESFPTPKPTPDPAPTPEPIPTPAPASDTPSARPQANTAIPEEVLALANLVKELGGVEGVKATLATIQANTTNERAGLVSEIVANSQMAESDLKGMELDGLRKLAQQVRPAYYMRPMPQAGGADSEWEEYQAPQPAAQPQANGK